MDRFLRSPRVWVVAAAFVAALVPTAGAQYSSDFEALAASAAGTILTGQDGYYIPAASPSVNYLAYTYAGNALGVPANPNGGLQFVAGTPAGGLFARAQRNLSWGLGTDVRTAGFDTCVFWSGAPPAVNNIGSFSSQDAAGANALHRSFNCLLIWTDTTTATAWSANILGFTAAGLASIFAPASLTGFPVSVWHRVEIDINFATNEILEVRVRNLTTGVVVRENPVGLYLRGGTAPTLPMPGAFRLFAGGAGVPPSNVLAADNVGITEGLSRGRFVATTLNTTIPAENTVQSVDPFGATATPVSIAGIPAGTLFDSVLVENQSKMLIGTRVLGGSGHIYRATWNGMGWDGTQLDTGPTGTESVAGLVVVGGNIYYPGSPAGGTGGMNAFVGQLPLAGGAPVTYVNLGAMGALGLGNAIAAIGTTLHVFTFDSTATGPNAQHWTVDTTMATAALVGDLPDSIAPAPFLGSNFGAVQAGYDANSGNLVVQGVYGDTLRRTPAGVNVLQIATPGTGGVGANLSDGLAVNSNNQTLGIGDRAAHYEELRCGSVFMNTYVTMAAPVTVATRVSQLAYVPSSANYTDLGGGCAQSNGQVPCNYSNSLPTKGNPAFSFTLQNAIPGTLAILLIGLSDPALDLTPFGAPGCTLHASIGFLAFPIPTSGTGTATVGPVAIPPGAMGTVYTDWIVVDPPANALDAVLSNGRRLDIG